MEGDDGLPQKVNSQFSDDSQGWLKYSQNTRILSLRPDGNNIGKHYIRINAIDSAGEKASIAIPIMVFWKNQNPIINTEGIVNRISKQNQGIKGVEMKEGNSQMRIELMENYDIEFKVPKDIFLDPDLAINSEEELNIIIIEERDETESLKLNNNELTINIDTRAQGITTPDGYVEWNVRIEGRDNSGAKIDLDVLFWLQRVAIPADLKLQAGNNRIYDEGRIISLEELVTINAIDYPDHKINLRIQHKRNEGQDINLIENEIFEVNPILEYEDIKEWRVTGSLNEITERIKICP